MLSPEKESFLTVRDVTVRYGISQMTVWRWEREAANFPKPMVVRDRKYYPLSGLLAFEATGFAEEAAVRASKIESGVPIPASDGGWRTH